MSLTTHAQLQLKKGKDRRKVCVPFFPTKFPPPLSHSLTFETMRERQSILQTNRTKLISTFFFLVYWGFNIYLLLHSWNLFAFSIHQSLPPLCFLCSSLSAFLNSAFSCQSKFIIQFLPGIRGFCSEILFFSWSLYFVDSFVSLLLFSSLSFSF